MGHSLFLSCSFLSAPFLWPIKPQILFIDYKSHMSFFSPQLFSEPQTYISDSPIQRDGSWVYQCYMSTRDPIIFTK